MRCLVPFRSAVLALAGALALASGLGTPVAAATVSQPKAAPATDQGWPRTFSSGRLEYTIYQPQLDSWDGNRLECHAAVSVGEKGSEAPEFGVLFFVARADVDKSARLVVLEEMRIPRVTFPAEKDGGEAFRADLMKFLPKRTSAIALDRIEADMAIVQAERKVEGLPLRNDPPRIVFSKSPAILLFVDGPPVWRAVEKPDPKAGLRRLVNTRPLVLQDAKGGLYLHLFDGWLESKALEGPWSVCKKPPKALAAVAKDLAPTNIVDLLEGEPSNPDDPKSRPSLAKVVPAVVVSETPTELIVTDGEPNYVPIEGTELLFVTNTTGHVFKHLGDQGTYVLLAGRWYRAPSLQGPWEYVPGKALPRDFAQIPDTSPKENVKASVPGTRQAKEAVIANSVPQTAKVDRQKVKVQIEYDGEPQLRAIPGTPLQYVVNTATPVIMVDARSWYAVDRGVWFVATGPKGPWAVAASVPAVIYTIPPSAPLHYVTYAMVYSATPEVVYVGYTPGYLGTVVSADAVVVYGTGYAHVPWVGVYYYPPPPTFGYAVAIRYTPWTGWTVGYGFGWSYGVVTVGIGWGCGPVWGPYYFPPYRGVVVSPYGAAAWGPGGWARTTGNVYSQYGSTSVVSRTSGGYNAYTGNRWGNQVGQSYNSATGQLSAGQRSAVANAYTGDYAAGRRGVTTNTRTGATAAGRQTISGNAYTGQYRSNAEAGGYNPETGRYAAGEKTTIGNSKTDQSVTESKGTIGNTKSGQSVDYKEVHGSGGRGAGEVGDVKVAKSADGDYYAGKDGNVYKKDADGGWSKYQPGGGTSPGGGGSPSSHTTGHGGEQWSQVEPGSPSTHQLNSSANARAAGTRNYDNYKSSPAGSEEGARSQKSAARGGGNRKR